MFKSIKAMTVALKKTVSFLDLKPVHLLLMLSVEWLLQKIKPWFLEKYNIGIKKTLVSLKGFMYLTDKSLHKEKQPEMDLDA